MKNFIQVSRIGLLLLTVTVLLVLPGPVAAAQEPQGSPAPNVELLTTNSEPNLSATGEGITSYKITDLFQRGSTRITLLKASEAPFTLELPLGYSIFNGLIYSVETNAVFAGPSDITFKLPSARTEQTFNQLRILYAQIDLAEPDVPRWIDATFTGDVARNMQGWFSEAESKERARNFGTRTLHAVTAGTVQVLIVAVLDPATARNTMTADLVVSGTATAQVTEGRTVNYKLQISNKGPDAATAISLHTTPSFSFLSVKATSGKCNMAGQNVYCKFPALEKDGSIAVEIIEQCEWNRHFPNAPPGRETPTTLVRKSIMVGATERDPVWENNQLHLITKVFRDSNQAPIIKILSPSPEQNFPGPKATVPIRFTATDPDGFIKKVEVFTYSLKSPLLKTLGEPKLLPDGTYELIYKEAPFGTHWIRIVATDNLGRVERFDAPEFFINATHVE